MSDQLTSEEALRAAVCIQRHKAHLCKYQHENWNFECIYCDVSCTKEGHRGIPSLVIWGCGDIQRIVPYFDTNKTNKTDLLPLGNGDKALSFT